MAKASPTQAWLWHRRLSHLNFDTINLLLRKDIVVGLPKLKYVKDQLCSSCELGKEKRSTFKTKVVPSLKGWLNLLHMDLCGPIRIESINGKKYIMVITVCTDRGIEFLNKTLHAYFKEEGIEQQTSTPRTPKQNSIVKRRNRTLASNYDNSSPTPHLQKTSDHNHSELDIQDHINELSSSTLVQNVSPPADTDAPSLQELDLLFSPLYDEFFIADNTSIFKSSSLSDNSQQQDTQPIANVQPITKPITPTTTVHAEENNDNQAEDARFEPYEFINPFYHPLEQVHGNPSKQVQTRRQLDTDLEMCMFALTMSTAEPKNIKKAMADSEWIKYLKDSGFELTAFSKANHDLCLDSRKSTFGGIQFLGEKLVSWMSKTQDCTAMSLAKVKYVELSISCAQVMWMRTQLKDYGIDYNKIPLYYDSQSAIAISCNPVQHSRTKHFHTRYHFIKKQVECGIIELYFVRTGYQLADMFTKAIPKGRF
uniref:Retrovirus-related Pol polyprotein from transposon TNT 1-94 n=1 Tax=Tanacetum cinerariifolium TaxID=118510 RepID=A0A699HG87_TANCI|nr:retrovirus-related Pol polyprotein from transposon TNT 1-94 [Tanacetum cinerariifolium]